MKRSLAGSFRFRSTTRRKRRFSVLCHTTAVYRYRCGSSSRCRDLETAQVLEIDLPIIFAPCPTALRVQAGVEQHAVGVAPQFGDRMQIETDDFINIFLLRIVAIHAMIGAARRQAMSMRTQLLRIDVDPGFFRLGLRGLFPRRRLCGGERQSAPACDIDYSERGNLQSTFGTARTAVEEVPETERLLATLRDEGRVMR